MNSNSLRMTSPYSSGTPSPQPSDASFGSRPNSAPQTRPNSAGRRQAQTGEAAPQSARVSRNLLSAFNAAAVLTPARATTASLRTTPNGSGWTSPQSEFSDDFVTQYVHATHDDAQLRVRRQYPDSVEAVARVVGDIFARDTPSAPSAPGAHTPPGRDQVESLDANFMDRLLVLTLVRRLPQLVALQRTGLSYFDLGVIPAAPLLRARSLARALAQDLQAAAHAPLLGGTQRAMQGALAVVVQGVQSGLETHDWGDGDPRYRDVGNALLSAVNQLGRLESAAMVRAAIDCFHQTRPTRPSSPN